MIKSFPFQIETLYLDSAIEVQILNRWSDDKIRLLLKNLQSGESFVQIIKTDKFRFENVRKGNQYSIEVGFFNLLKKIKYKKFKKQFLYTGPKKIRIIGTGSGRCGTASLAEYLDNMIFTDGVGVSAKHETLYITILNGIIEKAFGTIKDTVQSFSHNVEVAPYYSLVPETLSSADKVILLIRDGRKVVSSGMARGWFKRDSLWDKIKPDFQGSQFEKCCHLWKHTNENVLSRADITIRLEDLIDSNIDESFYEILNIEKPLKKKFPKKNVSTTTPKMVWNKKDFECFKSICGDLMDSYYKGWETDNLLTIKK
jgi:hypothetical protein